VLVATDAARRGRAAIERLIAPDGNSSNMILDPDGTAEPLERLVARLDLTS
jgi:hypothetical protein